MTPIYLAYAVLAVSLTLAMFLRRLGTPFAVTALAAGVILVASSIGRPKPIWAELQCDTSIATVLGSQLREDQGAIYLWLQPEGCEPTAYRFPWSKEFAQQVQDALDRAMGQGGSGTLMFERSYETREPKVYPLPQPKLPDKPPQEAPIVVPEMAT